MQSMCVRSNISISQRNYAAALSSLYAELDTALTHYLYYNGYYLSCQNSYLLLCTN